MIIDCIKNCNKCELHNNQPPLLDNNLEADILWVGLSTKKKMTNDEIPLSPDTKSGALIKQVEDALGEISTYKTNIVKCLPLDANQKLRYPNRKEIDACFENLITEINQLQPKIVFLLGQKVYSSVERNLGISFSKWEDYDYMYQEKDGVYYVPIQHPSYIAVYKRKYINDYISGICKVVREIYEKEV